MIFTMDCKALAERLFPDITQTEADIMAAYPKRNLPEGAKVTRIAPSPTGFMHLGNLYGALTDERLAHQSGGVFMLRIEDTDLKRSVEHGVEKIIEVFSRFGLKFDEGATNDGETGDYGPYYQRQRAKIYKVFAKRLVSEGKAYPCFATEEELEEIRQKQTAAGENPGCYGKYAIWRDAGQDRIDAALAAGKPYVIRLRSEGDPEKKIKLNDLVKGVLEMPENDNDIVLLKSDGIPTYHFAHVIDDTLMGTTHVVRGEEWLSTLPWHVQMFQMLGFKIPKYIHTAQLLKLDNGSKRKLSKRKDPELSLEFYFAEGYPELSLLEYLMTLLNSNYEDWRRANPEKSFRDFPFSVKHMSPSGALFDMEKLIDVSKNTISRMSASEVYEGVKNWAHSFDLLFYSLLDDRPDYAEKILAIGRGGAKPRKDLVTWKDAKAYMAFFYDELFAPEYVYPENVDDVNAILDGFAAVYSVADDAGQWFDRVKALAAELGYCTDMKEYKKDPSAWKGSVADVSMVLRVAVTGRQTSPDLCEVMKILGRAAVLKRLEKGKI